MDDPFQPLPEDLAILCQHRRAFGPGPGSSLASRSEPGGASLELPDSIGPYSHRTVRGGGNYLERSKFLRKN